MSILQRLRKNGAQEPKVLAALAGIGIQAYYDLGSRDDELGHAISVGSIARIARALGVKPSALFGGTSSAAISTDHLASLLREHVKRSDKPTAEFEDDIGWAIESALASPDEFRSFNADGLRDVCRAVKVDWLDVLDAIEP